MPRDRRPPRRLRRVVGTLRFRITLLAALVVGVILVLAAFGLVVSQRRQLTESLDESLEQQARSLRAAIARSDHPQTGLSGFGGDEFRAVVLTPGGRVIARSSDGLGRDAAVRTRTLRIRTPQGPRVLRVAATLEDVDESTAALIRSLVVAIPVVVLLLAAVIWWLVGRTLRPVDAIRSEVARIGAPAFDRRVPVPGGDDEIARLARTMNTMLDRLEEAHRRQEQFVADAAHELRSPLTRMRSELEVDEAHPAGANLAETHRSVLAETVALQHLVDDLLQLARSDDGAGGGVAVPVDLDDIVMRQVRRLTAEDRIAVDASGVSGAQVAGDPDQLTRAVRNLADNATRHAESRVAFTLVEDGDVARLTVADDGHGVPPEARERIFARFTRLDEARADAVGGAGLGLAITRDIVERHGGTVVVDDGPEPGTRFVVTLPIAGR
jgi:signal transduction histidine kinase